MNKLKHYREMIEGAGLAVDRIVQGKHFKFYVRAPDGEPHVFIAPRTGSDWRGDKNKLAQLRLFARQHING